MPEGHTIHLFAADHRRLFAGKRLDISSPQGRFTGSKGITGSILKDVRAHGKNLFYDFGKGKIVHIHLGLHGQFKLTEKKKVEEPPEPRGAVRLRFITDRTVLDLNGPIRCEVIDEADLEKVIARLGPDILDPDADPELAWKKISKRSTALALLLMDQTILSGIGNAYRCELLYRQHLHPLIPGKSVSRATFLKLWKDAVHLLTMGVNHRQAWAVDETDVANSPPLPDGQPDRYNVYRKETCRNCGTKVKILPLGGRRCFFCPKEQRLKR
jgi:endonuclease-8